MEKKIIIENNGCRLIYFPTFLSNIETEQLYDSILDEISLEKEVVYLFNKRYELNRSIAWINDLGKAYGYANTFKKAQGFTKVINVVKEKIELLTDTHYNSCLINLYPTGEDYMGWHTDNEKIIEKNSAIASLSLGATRDFQVRDNLTKTTTTITLESGDLILMDGNFQTNYKHQLPKRKKVKTARINLTFRKINEIIQF